MLDAIRIYIAVAETRNLSKVAKARGLAVSSISRKIDALETELGFKLFNRNSRLVILTDAGEQFLQRAKNILVELDEAKSSITASNADPKGLLTVTAPSAFGRLHIAPAIVSFLKRYPLMDIDLNINDDIVDLSSQRIDVAIRIGTLPDSDLVATHLAPFRRIVCASSDYLAQHGHPSSPQDLLQHNCLSPVGCRIVPGLWTFAGINRGTALPVQGNFRANDINSLLLAAIDGIGVVHLATWLVGDMVSSGKLIQLFSGTRDISLKVKPAIHAVRLPGRSHATKAQLFISHLKSEFGEPPYWDEPFLKK
jgi:DNA-binding transcriptional LysR family regulator